MATKTKVTRQNQLRQLMAGIDKHLTNVTSVTLAGADVPLPQVKAQLQADVDASDASVQAKANLAAVVQRERNSHANLEPTLRLFKSYVVSHFGDTNDASDVLSDFGLKPRPSPKTTVATKAEAAEKSKATREARHTMGPKQKAKIKGTVPAEQPSASSTAAPTSAPEPTPTPAASKPAAPAPTVS
jgi:hypothetical protein